MTSCLEVFLFLRPYVQQKLIIIIQPFTCLRSCSQVLSGCMLDLLCWERSSSRRSCRKQRESHWNKSQSYSVCLCVLEFTASGMTSTKHISMSCLYLLPLDQTSLTNRLSHSSSRVNMALRRNLNELDLSNVCINCINSHRFSKNLIL